MNPLMQQFIQEARDFLQGIGEKLMALEHEPDDAALMNELFRLVHTLKGNSGLFELPEMTRVLHAGEDLMDAVRDGRAPYSQALADQLLDAMDFVGMLVDELEQAGAIAAGHAAPAADLAASLRTLIPARPDAPASVESARADATAAEAVDWEALLAKIPEATRIEAWSRAHGGDTLFLALYRPEEECFFKGEDPFLQARRTPGLLWGEVAPRQPWPKGAEFDCYRCNLDFALLSACDRAELDEHFRYTPEQVAILPLPPTRLVVPTGHPNGGPVYGDFVAEALGLIERGDVAGLAAAARTLLELTSPDLWVASALRWLLAVIAAAPDDVALMRRLVESLNTLKPPDLGDREDAILSRPADSLPEAGATPPAIDAADRTRIDALLAAQAEVLALSDDVAWLPGRLRAVAATLRACVGALGDATGEIDEALAASLEARSSAPLRDWLAAWREGVTLAAFAAADELPAAAPDAVPPAPTAGAPGGEVRFGRRAEDAQASKVLKVDQAKVDRLMNLIGEMVVAKNALPYLANRAEDRYGVRELSREIKAQYAVINRIAEEMQDAIMQVRMMPVSFIFQRFPRLVRDVSRKLGKEVELVLEGEDTEADKNIVEALADPLIHIVRNSLDHGIETPEARAAAGKPRAGRLAIRARQESDRVVIEIVDDGKGIDPAVIKRKAYEKGVIDEAQIERLSDAEAVNLVFAAGFSTAETISDLSGRGVGMDVVKTAIEKVGGAVLLSSEVGKGTTLSLSLPLSMAVTNVMVIESDGQIFGVPMELVIETVRLPRSAVRTIKRRKTAVLRGRIVALTALNELLAIDAEPRANEEDELAALVVRVGAEQVGLLVDDFREVVDVILKPLPGELARLSCYAGTALLGDGSVLMVLNPKEMF